MIYEPRLRWPAGQPRTDRPERSRFGEHELWKLIHDVELEIDRMGGTDLCLSSELPLGRSGRPVQGWRPGDDHGVAVYWTQNGQPYCLAIDRYDHPLDNLRAVAKSLEALRALARWGGDNLMAQALSSFAELPAPGADWRSALGVGPDADLAECEAAYRRLIRAAHPDAGGSPEAAARLNDAIARARIEKLEEGK